MLVNLSFPLLLLIFISIMSLKFHPLHLILHLSINSVMTTIAGVILMNIFFSIQALDTRKTFYQGRSERGAYPIYPYQSSSQLHLSSKSCTQAFSSSVFNKSLWHMRLGHPNDQALTSLFPRVKSVQNNDTVVTQPCTHCLYRKMHKLSFPHSDFHASSSFELVHFDL